MAEAPLLHPIDEEALEEGELREGAPIERTERVPCTIALAKVHTQFSIAHPIEGTERVSPAPSPSPRWISKFYVLWFHNPSCDDGHIVVDAYRAICESSKCIPERT